MTGPPSDRLARVGPLAERFEVLAMLGKGGMGTVYRARDRGTGREVALKVVTEPDPEGTRRARFEREGQITASLVHPGIVRVHSAGAEGDLVWLAYELVDGGRTLAGALREADPRRRVELVRDVARAVGYAHAQGVVHRDLKPENVLVDPTGQVRVADFGLASARGLERLTRTGVMLGTPSYMAPEQVAASRDELGPATDVWALGVVLYEALTGELPFTGDSLIELAVAIGAARPAAPRSIDPSISPALEAVCLRALSRRPAERPADGEAFALELERALEGRSATRARRGLALSALVALSALALSALSLSATAWPAPDAAPGPRTPPTHAVAAAPTPPVVPPHEELGVLRELVSRGRALEATAWARQERERLAGSAELGGIDRAARARVVAATTAPEATEWLLLVGALRREGRGLEPGGEVCDATWRLVTRVTQRARESLINGAADEEASRPIAALIAALRAAGLAGGSQEAALAAVDALLTASVKERQLHVDVLREGLLAASTLDVDLPPDMVANGPSPAPEERGPVADALRLRGQLAKAQQDDVVLELKKRLRRYIESDRRFASLGPRTRARLVASAAPKDASPAWLDRLKEARELDPRNVRVAVELANQLQRSGQVDEARRLAVVALELDAAEPRLVTVTAEPWDCFRDVLQVLGRLGERDLVTRWLARSRARFTQLSQSSLEQDLARDLEGHQR